MREERREKDGTDGPAIAVSLTNSFSVAVGNWRFRPSVYYYDASFVSVMIQSKEGFDFFAEMNANWIELKIFKNKVICCYY